MLGVEKPVSRRSRSFCILLDILLISPIKLPYRICTMEVDVNEEIKSQLVVQQCTSQALPQTLQTNKKLR